MHRAHSPIIIFQESVRGTRVETLLEEVAAMVLSSVEKVVLEATVEEAAAAVAEEEAREAADLDELLTWSRTLPAADLEGGVVELEGGVAEQVAAHEAGHVQAHTVVGCKEEEKEPQRATTPDWLLEASQIVSRDAALDAVKQQDGIDAVADVTDAPDATATRGATLGMANRVIDALAGLVVRSPSLVGDTVEGQQEQDGHEAAVTAGRARWMGLADYLRALRKR